MVGRNPLSVELATVFARDGCELRTVLSGAMAGELCSCEHFDLILVAESLSDMEGVALPGAIRKDQRGGAIVLLSSCLTVSLLSRAMDQGFFRVVDLSLADSELTVLLEKILFDCRSRQRSRLQHLLLPLYQLTDRFAEVESPAEIYELLLDVVVNHFGVSRVSLMIFSTQDSCLRVVASRGLDPRSLGDICIRSGNQVAGWVFERGRPLILNRETQDQSPLASVLAQPQLGASLSIPLVGRKKMIGVLNLSELDGDGRFAESDIDTAILFCNQAVLALEQLEAMAVNSENSRMRALFEQYVAPEVAGVLLESSRTIQEVSGMRELTVLFADIRSFTSLFREIDPEDMRVFLSEFFDFFAETIFARQGMLDKFMGDAALAVFGAPVDLKEPSLHAAHAALDLVAGFEVLCQSWAERFPCFISVGLGVGISRGVMFIGNVGSARRLDFTVIGSDVNIAQRLASAAGPGQILISESVCQDLTGQLPVERMSDLTLHGLSDKTVNYQLKVRV